MKRWMFALSLLFFGNPVSASQPQEGFEVLFPQLEAYPLDLPLLFIFRNFDTSEDPLDLLRVRVTADGRPVDGVLEIFDGPRRGGSYEGGTYRQHVMAWTPDQPLDPRARYAMNAEVWILDDRYGTDCSAFMPCIRLSEDVSFVVGNTPLPPLDPELTFTTSAEHPEVCLEYQDGRPSGEECVRSELDRSTWNITLDILVEDGTGGALTPGLGFDGVATVTSGGEVVTQREGLFFSRRLRLTLDRHDMAGDEVCAAVSLTDVFDRSREFELGCRPLPALPGQDPPGQDDPQGGEMPRAETPPMRSNIESTGCAAAPGQGIAGWWFILFGLWIRRRLSCPVGLR